MSNKEVLLYFAIAVIIFATVFTIVAGVVGKEAIKADALQLLATQTEAEPAKGGRPKNPLPNEKKA